MTETAQNKKMIIGWFSFTCCEDSTILFTELLNEHFDDWKKLVEFRYCRPLKTKNEIRDLDVAFVEGAISSPTQLEELQKVRNESKYVVAIGACACTGMPSASRNQFTDEQITERINWYLKHFDYSKEVQKLEDVIKIDDKVEGCPMNANLFIETLTKYLKVFEVV